MDRKNIQWQPLVEMIIVLLTILGSTIPLYIHTDNKMEKLNNKLNERIEKEIAIQMAKIDVQNARTDRLYEMFIDLLKEGKK